MERDREGQRERERKNAFGLLVHHKKHMKMYLGSGQGTICQRRSILQHSWDTDRRWNCLASEQLCAARGNYLIVVNHPLRQLPGGS